MSPVLRLLSSLQMEILLLVAEKSDDVYSEEGRPLLVDHAKSVLSSSEEVVDVLLKKFSGSSHNPVSEWETLADAVRMMVEGTFVGNILPMLCTGEFGHLFLLFIFLFQYVLTLINHSCFI